MREKVQRGADAAFDGFDVPQEVKGQQAAPPPGVRKILVHWGDEHIQPIQYNGFHTGQLEMEVEVPPGGDVRAIYEQTWKLLDELGQQQYQRKLDGFLNRAAAAANEVRARAPGKTR